MKGKKESKKLLILALAVLILSSVGIVLNIFKYNNGKCTDSFNQSIVGVWGIGASESPTPIFELNDDMTFTIKNLNVMQTGSDGNWNINLNSMHLTLEFKHLDKFWGTIFDESDKTLQKKNRSTENIISFDKNSRSIVFQIVNKPTQTNICDTNEININILNNNFFKLGNEDTDANINLLLETQKSSSCTDIINKYDSDLKLEYRNMITRLDMCAKTKEFMIYDQQQPIGNSTAVSMNIKGIWEKVNNQYKLTVHSISNPESDFEKIAIGDVINLSLKNSNSENLCSKEILKFSLEKVDGDFNICE